MNDAARSSAQSPSKALSPSDREALQREFAENGYLVIRDFVPRDLLDPLCASILEAYEAQLRSGKPHFSDAASVPCEKNEKHRWPQQSTVNGMG